MHTIKLTPNLLFEYQRTSGKFIRMPNRIEKNRFGSENRTETFLPELECSSSKRYANCTEKEIVPREWCVCRAVQRCQSWSRQWRTAAGRPSVDRKERGRQRRGQSGPGQARRASDSASAHYLQHRPHTLAIHQLQHTTYSTDHTHLSYTPASAHYLQHRPHTP